MEAVQSKKGTVESLESPGTDPKDNMKLVQNNHNMDEKEVHDNLAYKPDSCSAVQDGQKQKTDESCDRAGDCSDPDKPKIANIPNSETTNSDEATTPLLPVASLDANKSSGDECKPWDVFRRYNRESNHTFTDTYEFFKKLFKVLTVIFVFLVVLGGSMVNKATMLYAAGSARKNLSATCFTWQVKGENNTVAFFDHCILERPSWDHRYGPVPWCANRTKHAILLHRSSYSVCNVVTVRWIWCLILIMCTPYFCVFLRNLWSLCFKKTKAPTWQTILLTTVMQTLHVTGISLLVFGVLPMLNVLEAIGIMLGVSILPSLLRIINRPPKENFRLLRITGDILAFLCQISVLVMWPVMANITSQDDVSRGLVIKIPISLFLISFGWWENYVDKDTRLGNLGKLLCQAKKNIRRSRTKLYIIVSLWKIILTILLAMLLNRFKHIDIFRFDHDDKLCPPDTSVSLPMLKNMRLDWVYVWLVNFVVGIFTYFCARSAVKVQIQKLSYAVPLAISSPLLVVLLYLACGSWEGDECTLAPGIPGYAFWNCADNFGKYKWVMVLWWVSHLWVTSHIWFPTAERLAKTDKLFFLPLWDSTLLEPWLLHNRYRNDHEFTQEKKVQNYVFVENEADDMEAPPPSPTREKLLEKDAIPMIYICATMWHETENEMIQVLKSIFNLDHDQCARRKAQDFFEITDPDYYEFEAHIFFDDAMEGRAEDEWKYQVNTFVKLLVRVINVAASAFYKVDVDIPPPIKYPTPYGGRLEWTLPGGNKLVAHLKDKMKIRHKKRWSQVMYMYYFLGFRLWTEIKDIKRKQTRADNTFLLALDGDVDFEPIAVQLLVDLMKKDIQVGAACGRIHPIGSGPMVWYQKFEYALGHWMQKATEHVLGCVLCSPGCFSLFRGSALMDDNVMCMYATMSTTAQEYVQYDQGEDRWLCTLLLQQGYRVEYSAASDALTYAPEGFEEFFNQRRRWAPSTMANIMDLLMSWRHTVKVHDSISFIYILYQGAIFVTSLVGPGMIFLMIVGALRVVLGNSTGMTEWMSFFINLVPVLLFMIVCFTAKSSTQLAVASVLTAIYAIVQMLVFISILLQIRHKGLCSPTAMLFLFIAGAFILAALVHPQEFFCLAHGMLYFLAIPSMYMLLMMYSICNLHIVSWGTREVKQTATEKQQEEEKKLEAEQKQAKKKPGGLNLPLLAMLNAKSAANEEGFNLSLGNLCRCLCCPRPAPPPDDSKFKMILDRLGNLEAKIESAMNEHTEDPLEDESVENISIPKRRKTVRLSENTDTYVYRGDLESIAEESEEQQVFYDEMVNPYWIQDEDLRDGPKGKLPDRENQFFSDLINKYLFPLPPDKAKEERVQMELLDLRNKMSLAFYLMNIVFVTVTFTLQIQSKDFNLSIPWFCGNEGLDPIGLFFIIFYGMVISLQLTGMMFHRMSTFLHVVATTSLNCRRKSGEQRPDDKAKSMVALVKGMMQPKNNEDDSDSEIGGSIDGDRKTALRRKPTCVKIQKSHEDKPKQYQTLDAVFARRFLKLREGIESESRSPKEIQDTVMGHGAVRVRGFKRRQSLAAIRQLKERKVSLLPRRFDGVSMPASAGNTLRPRRPRGHSISTAGDAEEILEITSDFQNYHATETPGGIQMAPVNPSPQNDPNEKKRITQGSLQKSVGRNAGQKHVKGGANGYVITSQIYEIPPDYD